MGPARQCSLATQVPRTVIPPTILQLLAGIFENWNLPLQDRLCLENAVMFLDTKFSRFQRYFQPVSDFMALYPPPIERVLRDWKAPSWKRGVRCGLLGFCYRLETKRQAHYSFGDERARQYLNECYRYTRNAIGKELTPGRAIRILYSIIFMLLSAALDNDEHEASIHGQGFMSTASTAMLNVVNKFVTSGMGDCSSEYGLDPLPIRALFVLAKEAQGIKECFRLLQLLLHAEEAALEIANFVCLFALVMLFCLMEHDDGVKGSGVGCPLETGITSSVATPNSKIHHLWGFLPFVAFTIFLPFPVTSR